MLKAPCIDIVMWLIFLTTGFALNVGWAQTNIAAPTCPTDSTQPYPEFGKVGHNPGFAVWLDLPSLPDSCLITLQQPATMTIALAARFEHTGSLTVLAERLGAVSTLKNLNYWSVTDNGWQKMISQAVALESPSVKTKRPNFTSPEILSGQTLYFAQNDTRSWGLNIYSFRALSSSPDRLILSSENESPIKLGPITLFEPHSVQTLLFIDKINDSIWSYYSLAVIKETTFGANEKSLVNRQAALYQHLAQPAEQPPPLAP